MTPKEQAVLLVPSMTGASAAFRRTVAHSIIPASFDLPVFLLESRLDELKVPQHVL